LVEHWVAWWALQMADKWEALMAGSTAEQKEAQKAEKKVQTTD
jgi:hypothetical protein